MAYVTGIDARIQIQIQKDLKCAIQQIDAKIFWMKFDKSQLFEIRSSYLHIYLLKKLT